MRDRTTAISRAIRSDLAPGEVVLAGVSVARRGTGAARVVAASRAADADAPTVIGPDGPGDRSGGAGTIAVEGIEFYLVLTDARVLVVRRSIFGRASGVVLDLPLGEVADVRLPRGSQIITIEHTDGRRLRLELPKAQKFLPEVYRELPARFAAAAAKARQSSAGETT